jgi:hypothetical protein
MMNLYFNHSVMENTSLDMMQCYLQEIIKLKAGANRQSQTIYFYQDFWNLEFAGINLSSYLCSLNDKESVKAIITSVMNGPYYYKNIENNLIYEVPKVDEGSFGRMLISICFKDNESLILSLNGEVSLCEEKYEVKEYVDRNVNFNILNIKGEQRLNFYFNNKEIYKNIYQVFENIEKNNHEVVLLSSAKKSAKKHDFRDCFEEIYRAIEILAKAELPLLLKGENDELRKNTLHLQYGIEISKESAETLSIERYRKEREFIIPQRGTELFQWHVKIQGGNTRIHYFIDKENKKVYIGHCGKHLGTSGYSS